jgi:hypothetical protein
MRDFPEATIVTASFTINNKFNQGRIFGPHDYVGKVLLSIRGLNADIFLYDGPPKMAPGRGNKLVSFTCPNYDWFKVMRKTPYHARMHLPFWSLEELLKARGVLQIGLDDETIKER